MKATTIAQEELDQFLQVSRDVFRRASVASARGRALLATPPTGKYPYVYTRDLAVTIAALCELDSLEVARDFCRFLLRRMPSSLEYDQEAVLRQGNFGLPHSIRPVYLVHDERPDHARTASCGRKAVNSAPESFSTVT